MTDFKGHTDEKGRTTADRIDAVAARRNGDPLTASQRDDAIALLDKFLDAAEGYRINLDDFDFVADLPGAIVDAVGLLRVQRRQPIQD
jgi:hypothetical protein